MLETVDLFSLIKAAVSASEPPSHDLSQILPPHFAIEQPKPLISGADWHASLWSRPEACMASIFALGHVA